MGAHPPSSQPTLASFLKPASDSAPAQPSRRTAAAPGAQRTLHSLARVVTLPRGVAAADHLRAALPALAGDAAEADPDAALAALRRLACVDVSRQDLVETGAGVAVRRLKTCSHYDVSVLSARLVEKWKKCVIREIEVQKEKEAARRGE
jgi:TFIIS helical bundle-like domain